MQRWIKNTIMVGLLVILIGGMFLSLNHLKNVKLSDTNEAVVNNNDRANGGMVKGNDRMQMRDEEMPDMEVPDGMMGEMLPDGEGNQVQDGKRTRQNGTTTETKREITEDSGDVRQDNRPNMNDDEERQFPNGQPSMDENGGRQYRNNQANEDMNNIPSKQNNKVLVYCIMIGCSVFISVIIVYLLLSKFNKKSLKETFDTKEKYLVAGLLCLFAFWMFVACDMYVYGDLLKNDNIQVSEMPNTPFEIDNNITQNTSSLEM